MESKPHPNPAETNPAAEAKAPQSHTALDQKLGQAAIANQPEAADEHRETPASSPSIAARAIELYASGMPITQASQEVGMSESWLRMWKQRTPQKFESLLTQSLKKAGLEERPNKNPTSHRFIC